MHLLQKKAIKNASATPCSAAKAVLSIRVTVVEVSESISLHKRPNRNLGMQNSVDFGYFLIWRKATIPDFHLR